MKISFFGDFKINNITGLSLSNSVQSILNSCDINVVNFEAPVHCNSKPIKKSGPSISQDIAAPQWLLSKGFNAISLANNHIFDFGKDGLEKTIDSFSGTNAIVMGAGTSWQEAYKIHKVEINGISVGFLACTHCEFGTLTDEWDLENTQGCAWICHPQIDRLIIQAKKEVDVFFLYVHAGVEYLSNPLPEWRTLYRHFIDIGADAVIASHPHVPQGWEVYNKKPICYSLGNFCFQKNVRKYKKDWNNSLCAILEIDNEKNVSVSVKSIEYDPEKLQIDTKNDSRFESQILNLNSILIDPTKYIEQVNKEVVSLLPTYSNLFASSGFVHNPFSKGVIKSIVKGIQGKDFFPKTHLLNNLRCESHRWAITRALKITKKLTY